MSLQNIIHVQSALKRVIQPRSELFTVMYACIHCVYHDLRETVVSSCHADWYRCGSRSQQTKVPEMIL
jgi:hypothetical protein